MDHRCFTRARPAGHGHIESAQRRQVAGREVLVDDGKRGQLLGLELLKIVLLNDLLDLLAELVWVVFLFTERGKGH